MLVPGTETAKLAPFDHDDDDDDDFDDDFDDDDEEASLCTSLEFALSKLPSFSFKETLLV